MTHEERGTPRSSFLLSAFIILRSVAGLVPPRVAYLALDLVGDLAWLLNRPGRRAVEANLARVIGSRGPRWRRAVRRAFRSGARSYYDTFRVPRLTAAEIEQLVSSHGWEHLEAARAAGRGAIIASAHLGGLPISGRAVAVRGYRVNVVVEPLEPPELLRLFSRVRGGAGVDPIPLGPRLVPELLARLARNEVVVLVVDRDVVASPSMVRVPFFGVPARLPAGPALLALRSGAPILPGIVVRRPGDRFEGVLEPPIPIVRSGDLRADVERVTRAVTARLEYYIGRHPEQWTVFQPVWNDEVPRSSFLVPGSWFLEEVRE